MRDRLDEVIAQAQAEQLLPASAVRPSSEQRPWPVVLLTALGAWLAAIPLLGVVGTLLGPIVSNPVGPYVVGVLVLAGSVVMLRSASVPLFVEQLAVPGLLVGAGSLGFGLFKHLPDGLAALVLAGVAVALGVGLRQSWLRVLMGAAAAVLVGLAVMTVRGTYAYRPREHDLAWLACHLLLLLGVAWPWLQARWRGQASAVESLSAGWWLVTLAGLAVWAGMTFLVGGATGSGFVGEVAREVGRGVGRRTDGGTWFPITSVLLALSAAAVAARAWTGLRQPALALVAITSAVLAWFMPTLGGVLLGLACLLVAQRWRLAAAAGAAAAWIVGAFYYALSWPLADKALVLAAAGAVLGAMAWWLRPRAAQASPTAEPVPLDRRTLWVGVGTAATLAVAGFAIWQKQDLIAHGAPVYVELAPVDPRSLMQGDYMRLNFRVPSGLLEVAPSATAERPKMVARRDERGVAVLQRVAAPSEALGAGEFLFELTPKGGSWILVSDAWYFREGDAERWAQARFGEFRVMPDGRALLVGMADEKLRPIKP